MRVLHTSDWHLGVSLGEVSLLSHQRAFLEWLVALVGEREVDLVIVAGDLFDRVYAPTDALRLFRDAVQGLREAGAVFAAIAGNHDAADRVANYGPLLDASGVYIRGGYSEVGEVTRIEFRDGPLDLIMLPFLSPQLAPDHFADEGPPADEDEAKQRRRRRTHESVLDVAIRSALGKRTCERSIAVSHAFVRGGNASPSDAEKSLAVGGAELVSGELFEDFTYTALGHLHRPQLVNGREHIRYSGTPIAYSFSEDHEKKVVIFDMDGDGSISELEEVDVPCGRGVVTFRDSFAELLIREYTEVEAEKFARVVLNDTVAVPQAKQRLLTKLPHLLQVQFENPSVVGPVPPPRRSTRTTLELALEFWQIATSQAATPAQSKALQMAMVDPPPTLDQLLDELAKSRETVGRR